MGILDPLRSWFLRKQETALKKREIVVARRELAAHFEREGFQVINNKVLEYASRLKMAEGWTAEDVSTFASNTLFTTSPALSNVEDVRGLIGNDPYARRAIEFVCGLGSNIPLRVYDENDELIEGTYLDEFVKNPCSHLGYSDWVHQSMGWLISAGRLLYKKDRQGTEMKLVLIPSNILMVPTVSPVASPLARIRQPFVYFRYGNDKILPEESIYAYVWSPSLPAGYEAFGEGLLTAARLDLGVNIHGTEMMYQLLRKGGLPPYFYTLDAEVEIDADEEERMRQQVKTIQGPNYISDVPGLPPGMDIKALPVSARELQIVQTRQLSSEGIAVAVGVSLSLLKAGTMTYENLLQGKILAYESAVCPMLNTIAGAINRDKDIVKPELGLHVAFDYTVVKDLVPLSPQAFVASIPNMYLIMDEEEIRQVSPWKLSAKRPGKQPPKPPKKVDESKALEVVVTKLKERDAKNSKLTLAEMIRWSKSYGGYSGEVRKKYWEERSRELLNQASAFAIRLKDIYEDEKRQVTVLLQDVKRDLSDLPPVGEWFDWKKEEEALRNMASPILLETASQAARKIHSSFIPNREQRARAKKFAKEFASEVCDVTFSRFKDAVESVKAKFPAVAKQGDEEEPEEKPDKKDALRDMLAGFWGWCLGARLILDSETNIHNAQGYGLTEGMDEAGVEKKQWVLGTPPSGKHREWHEVMEGQTVPIDEPFISGNGVELMYAGDIMCGDPAEFCNCFCQTMPAGKE